MTTALPEANQNQSPDEHLQISRRLVQQAREELDQGERLPASQKAWPRKRSRRTPEGDNGAKGERAEYRHQGRCLR